MPTPNDMPQRKPKHTWSPPVNLRSTPMPAAHPGPAVTKADNARARRAKRNGWRERQDAYERDVAFIVEFAFGTVAYDEDGHSL